ncbi:MAG: hypothetical protein WKF77_20255 [Planctomycetaceae bacterium]
MTNHQRRLVWTSADFAGQLCQVRRTCSVPKLTPIPQILIWLVDHDLNSGTFQGMEFLNHVRQILGDPQEPAMRRGALATFRNACIVAEFFGLRGMSRAY